MSRDGSDWDYINEHMGGHDEDGLPNFMSEPGFADNESRIEDEHGYFGTFQEAIDWAKKNPGQTITRAPDGQRFMIKEKNNNLSRGNGKPIVDSKEFWKRISYRLVGHLNVELLRKVLRQLTPSELMSLKPLLNVELKSCYEAIERCRIHKKKGRNEALQAGDIEKMLAELNLILNK